MTESKYPGTTKEFAKEDKGQPRERPNGADRRQQEKKKAETEQVK